MRFLIDIDIDAAAGGICGRLRQEDEPDATPFQGWLQLMALLEAHGQTSPTES